MTGLRPPSTSAPASPRGSIVLLLLLCASSAAAESDEKEGFEGSKYNSEVCAKFDRFYHKKFQVDYDTCHLLYNYPNFSKQFEEYTNTYKKVYPNATENKKRYATFAANLLFIMVENAKQKVFKVGVNRYADMTPDEFTSTHTGLTLGSQKPALGGANFWRGDALPNSIDWVEKGAVNAPPPNQGSCNSCWAFAVAAAIEGAWKIKTGTLVQLSPQQFTDCTGMGLGCATGGNLETPITNVAKKKALCSESSYAYTGKQGYCANRPCEVVIPRGGVTGYVSVRSNDMLALMSALAHKGPVAVGIDAGGNQVMFYSSGILSAACSDNLNHAVLVVGYGHEGNTKYWKLKNSWGPDWGEQGFFRLIRGLPGAGQCGVLAIPTYYTVAAGGRLGEVRLNDTTGETPPSTGMPWEGRPNSGVVVLAVCVAACFLLSALGCCCCFRSAKDRGLSLEEGEDEEDDEEDSDVEE